MTRPLRVARWCWWLALVHVGCAARGDPPPLPAYATSRDEGKILDIDGGIDEIIEFVKTEHFRAVYFEKRPVLLRTGAKFRRILSLKKVLSGRYRVNGNKNVPPYRNVRFLPGNFYDKGKASAQLGHADGAEVGRVELMAAGKTNHTLQFLGAWRWWGPVNMLLARLTRAVGLPSNVNVYVTPPDQQVSIPVHNDFTCNLMVQTSGAKRWTLWVRERDLTPTRETHINGRDEAEIIADPWHEFGEPHMEVVLVEGDVLYVPRGVYHLTSTEGLGIVDDKDSGDRDGRGDEETEQGSGGKKKGGKKSKRGRKVPSVHLTTQLAVMNDDTVPHNWGDAFIGHDNKLGKAVTSAIMSMWDRPEHRRLREALPLSTMRGAALSPSQREAARLMLHSVIDEIASESNGYLDNLVATHAASNDNFLAKLEDPKLPARVGRPPEGGSSAAHARGDLGGSRAGGGGRAASWQHPDELPPWGDADPSVDPILGGKYAEWRPHRESCASSVPEADGTPLAPSLASFQLPLIAALHPGAPTATATGAASDGAEIDTNGDKLGPGEPSRLASARALNELTVNCVHESAAGFCSQVAASESEGGGDREGRQSDSGYRLKAPDDSNEPPPALNGRGAVLLLTYGRRVFIPNLIAELDVQTSEPFDLFVYNSNTDREARCELEAKIMATLVERGLLNGPGARGDDSRAERAPIRSIWIYHSPTNNAGFGQYGLAAALAERYETFIFFDDDVQITPGHVKTFLAESRQQPQAIFSAWGLTLESFQSYWHREAPEPGDYADYCGSAEMVTPAGLFADFNGSMVDFYPNRYRAMCDMWLNGYAVVHAKMELRRSHNPMHSSRNIDEGVVLSKKTGIRELKTEFMQMMSLRDGYPFTSRVGSFDQEWAKAMIIAKSPESDPLDVVHGFERITKNWQHRSHAFNNLAVARLRLATTLADDPHEMRRMLLKAREASHRSLFLGNNEAQGNLDLINERLAAL